MSQDEYIDYSCSTPLERLARDVQTKLRSWHIVGGSDRHISFHRQKSSRGVERCASFRGIESDRHVSFHRQKSSRGIERCASLRGIERCASFPIDYGTESKEATNDTVPIRPMTAMNKTAYAKVTESNTPLRNAGGGVMLIRSEKLKLVITPPNSLHHPEDRVTVELELCLWDGPPVTSTPFMRQHIQHTQCGQSIPLSLRTYRTPENNNKEVLDNDLISNLSSLLGIGQHLTLCPSNESSLTSLLQSTIEALIILNYASGKKGGDALRRRKTLSPSDCSSIYSNMKPQDQVTMHSTALHSLSGQLQMALNLALSDSDCRIPSFGIWGLYHPSDTTNNGLGTKREYLMAVPDWMNGGSFLQLAEELNPCCALLHHLNRSEEEEKTQKQHMERKRDGNSSNDGEGSTGQRPSPRRQSSLRVNTRTAQLEASSSQSFSSLMSPSALIQNVINKSLASSKTRNSKRLYLPAFLMGYCHSGPAIMAKGATFAIHVVPPGISCPIHCTTLNSLGKLLLQHSPPPPPAVNAKTEAKALTSSGSHTNLPNLIPQEKAQVVKDSAKVEVVWARHKYTWSKLFELQQLKGLTANGRVREDHSLATMNVWTCGLPWRRSCDIDAFAEAGGSQSEPSPSIMKYQNKCREQALKMLHRAILLSTDKENNGEIEPLWGPVDDPLLSVCIMVTWTSNSKDGKNSMEENVLPASSSTEPVSSLLTLPICIRSQKTLSSQDVLEMENSLLSTIFNPLAVPSSDFLLSVKTDPHAAATSLSAQNRIILAALIRVSSLEPDVLLAHLSKDSILQGIHDRQDANNVAADLMKNARIGRLTRKLVDVMDWESMAKMVSNEEPDFEQKLDKIVKEIMYGPEMRGYPTPPDDTSETPSSNGGIAFDFPKAAAPGRMLSVFFSCMPRLLWPHTMTRLWLKFVTELRMRWERRESLQNLGKVKGLDSQAIGRKLYNGETGDVMHEHHQTIGHSAKNFSFVHSSEPNPNLNECVISQQLQVFNIGVETMIAKENEILRKEMLAQETKQEEINESSDQDGEQIDNNWCAKSEAATEVRGNTRIGHKASGNGNFQPGIQEGWCAKSEAATEVRGNIAGKKTSGTGDSQITASTTTASGVNSFSLFTPHQPINSMENIDENEDFDSDSVRSADSQNLPMMFDPRLNKFRPISDIDDNNSGHIILNKQPKELDMQSSSTGTGDFFDAFTTIETDTYDNGSRYAVSSEGNSPPEILDDFDYDFIPFEEPGVNVAKVLKREGARCPVMGVQLCASGDQLYAPFLQRPDPITDKLILERRNLLSAALLGSSSSTSVRNRLELVQRFEKPKLKSDMSAFKAANPGAVFQDFTGWYGNPENPLQQFKDETSSCTTDEVFQSIDMKCANEEAEEARFVLDSTREFWSNAWDETLPIPASEQNPLFDAFSTVEMLLMSFEDMHPAFLVNQIMAVHFAMTYFVLSSSKPVCRLDLVDCSLQRLSRTIETVLEMLNKDLMEGLMHQVSAASTDGGSACSFSPITPATLTACEQLCDQIVGVENLLSRATSLLSKFSGDSSLVQRVLQKSDGYRLSATSHDSRSGILKEIQCQQQRNSGSSTVCMDDIPFPSVREYILRNSDDCNPCQLTVSIGGTHGLEKGGTNSTMGGLVLALNKCVSGIK